MAFITELDIVNACLKSMGEQPLNSISGGSPIVTAAQESLRTAIMAEQAQGWWFNKEAVTLVADTDGYFYAPADTLDLDTDLTPPWLSTRGSRLYDNRAGEYFRDKGSMVVHIIRLVPLDDLPYTAQRLIQTAAVLDFQNSYDADEAKVAKAQEAYATARVTCTAAHIRNVGANALTQGVGGANTFRSRRFYGRDERWS
ncbi:tail protein [Pseudomonas phage vB_PpuP-Kurepalu-1]